MSLPINHKPAFTLIELLVVITIIGLLATLSFGYYQQTQKKGRDTKRKADLKAIQQALQSFYTYAAYSGSIYPTSSSGLINCGGPSSPFTAASIQWGSAFTCSLQGVNYFGPPTFMQQLPQDPTGATPYYYADQSATGQGYQLYAKLENTQDKDVYNNNSTSPNIPAQCLTTATPAGLITTPYASGYNYCVINP